MTAVLAILPLGFAAVVWWGLYRFNLRHGWFRLGELIFWDAIALIVVYLVWLRWF